MTPSSPTPQNIPDLHPWKKYMPSKKIQLALLVIIIVVIGYSIHKPVIRLVKRIQEGKIFMPDIPVSVSASQKSSLSTDKDTDGDGLMDWQEVLIGTDPTEPDRLDDIPADIRDLVNTPGVITDDDKLALAIYQRATTDPIGDTIEEQVSAATTKEILALADSIDRQFTLYGYNDLTIIDDTASTNASFKTLFDGFLEKTALTDTSINQIFTVFLSPQSTTIAPTFSTINVGNLNTLLDMPVPLRTSELFLTYVNAYAHAYQALQKVVTQKDLDQSTQYALLLVFQKNMNLMAKIADTINMLSSNQ